MSDSIPISEPHKPASDMSPLEAYLTRVHGNLHGVMPEIYNRTGSFASVASELSDDMQSVSYGWVRRWFVEHGYKRVSRMERRS